MPNIDDINKLGALIYTLGNKPLARNISKKDVNGYHSIFTQDVLDTIMPVANTEHNVPSLDDLDKSDDLKEPDLSKDLNADNSKSDDLKNNENNTDDASLPNERDILDSLDEVPLPKSISGENETSDDNIDDLLGGLDTTEDGGDSNLAGQNKENTDLLDASDDGIADSIENPPDISDVNIDDVFSSITEDISDLADNAIINAADDETSTGDISDDLKEIIDESPSQNDEDDISSDLDRYFDEGAKNENKDIENYFEDEKQSDYPSSDGDADTAETLTEEDLTVLKDAAKGEDNDILSNFDDIINPFENDDTLLMPEDENDLKDETKEESTAKDIDDTNKEIPPDVLGENDIDLPSSDFAGGENTEENALSGDMKLPSIDEIDKIYGEKEETKSEFEDIEIPAVSDEIESKYKNIDEQLTESDIEKIMREMRLLPNTTQRYVTDIILNDKLDESDMTKLLVALGTGAGAKAVADIIKDCLGVSIHDDAERKSKTRNIKEIFFGHYLSFTAKIAGVVSVIFLLLFLIFNFVYRPLRSASYFKKGYDVLQKSDYESAEINFAKGDKIRPNQIKWYNKYARAYIDRLAFEYAKNKIDKAIAIKSRDFKTRMTLGYYYQRLAENDYSEDIYIEGENMYNDMLIFTKKRKDVVQLYDGLGRLQISRADTLDQKDYYNKAFDTYKEMIAKTGDGVLPRKMGMLIKIKQDDYEQVKYQRERINRMKKNYFDYEVYPELAKYLLNKDELFDARTLLEKILFKNPTNVPSLISLADYYIRINHHDTAIKILSVNVMKEYDKNIFMRGREYAHNMLGQAYYTMREYGSAMKEFQNALAINSLYADANYNMGNIYFYQENDYQKAENNYLIAYANMREEYMPLNLNYNLGWIAYNKKEYDTSFAYFYKIFDKVRGNAVLSYAIGNTLVHLDKENLALGFYIEALNILLERKRMLGTMYMVANKEFFVLNYLASLYNNIGVANIRKFTKMGDSSFEKDGFVSFVKSAECFDQVRVARRELLLEETRVVNVENQEFGIATYNLVMLQTKRPLYKSIKPDDYIPKDMYYVD